MNFSMCHYVVYCVCTVAGVSVWQNGVFGRLNFWPITTSSVATPGWSLMSMNALFKICTWSRTNLRYVYEHVYSSSKWQKQDRQTDRIYTNIKTLVKTGYIRRKFVIDCLYSRELVTKTELAITPQGRNMNECNAHNNIRFLDVYKCL